MSLRPSGVLLLLASIMSAAPARADEAPPPSFFSCHGKAPGDACEADDGPGKCVAETCSRLDYSQGTPPRTVESDCLRCRKDAAPAVAAGSDQPPATATAGSAATAKSGCQIDAGPGAAPLLLLALAAIRRRGPRRVSRRGTRR